MRTVAALMTAGVLIAAATVAAAPAEAASARATFRFTTKAVFTAKSTEHFVWKARAVPGGGSVVLQRTASGKYSRGPSRFVDVRTLVRRAHDRTERGSGTIHAPRQGHYRYRVVVRNRAGHSRAVSPYRNAYSYREVRIDRLVGADGSFEYRADGEDQYTTTRYQPAVEGTPSSRTDTYRHTTCNRIALAGALDTVDGRGRGSIRVDQGGRRVSTLSIDRPGPYYEGRDAPLRAGTLSITYASTSSPLFYDGVLRCWTPDARSVT